MQWRFFAFGARVVCKCKFASRGQIHTCPAPPFAPKDGFILSPHGFCRCKGAFAYGNMLNLTNLGPVPFGVSRRFQLLTEAQKLPACVCRLFLLESLHVRLLFHADVPHSFGLSNLVRLKLWTPPRAQVFLDLHCRWEGEIPLHHEWSSAKTRHRRCFLEKTPPWRQKFHPPHAFVPPAIILPFEKQQLSWIAQGVLQLCNSGPAGPAFASLDFRSAHRGMKFRSVWIIFTLDWPPVGVSVTFS